MADADRQAIAAGILNLLLEHLISLMIQSYRGRDYTKNNPTVAFSR